jgi:hypothetical protein
MSVGDGYFERSVVRLKRRVLQRSLPTLSVATIETWHGPRLLPQPSMIRVSVMPGQLHTLIPIIECDAAEAERKLRFSAAGHPAHRTMALRPEAP